MNMLKVMQYTPSHHGVGVTVLELYAISCALAPARDSAHNGVAKHDAIKTKLTEFVVGIKAIVHAIMHPDMWPLFKASQHNGNRLDCLGISSRVMHFNFNIALEHVSATTLTLALLSLHAP